MTSAWYTGAIEEKMVMQLTASRLREILDYDPETGVFTWHRRDRKEWNTRYAGKPAGRLNKGYAEISIDARRYSAHRLAWLYVYNEWPSGQIDHINCARADNRIDNLRLATNGQNMWNAHRRADNTSGFKGVAFHQKAGKWQAYINVNGRRQPLGLFDLAEQAHAAYCEAAERFHGEFARFD